MGTRIKLANLAQWQAQGHDLGSLLADPPLADPAHGDFALKPGSPALKLGFRPIDLSQVGPRPASVAPGGSPGSKTGQVPSAGP